MAKKLKSNMGKSVKEANKELSKFAKKLKKYGLKKRLKKGDK